MYFRLSAQPFSSKSRGHNWTPHCHGLKRFNSRAPAYQKRYDEHMGSVHIRPHVIHEASEFDVFVYSFATAISALGGFAPLPRQIAHPIRRPEPAARLASEVLNTVNVGVPVHGSGKNNLGTGCGRLLVVLAN